MTEFTLHLPAIAEIKAYGRVVRFDDTKPECRTAARGYLGFAAGKQFLTDTASPIFPKHPKIADPLSFCQNDSGDRAINDRDEGKRPVFLFDG